jgi:hypothetical protein
MMSKRIRILERKAKELSLDIKAIVEEHDSYKIDGDPQSWFEKLPIETLYESFEREYGIPRKVPPLPTMIHKFGLRKLHDKTQEELQRVEQELRVARIEDLLGKIDKLL